MPWGESALKLLIEQRDASSDPKQAELFAELIRRIEHRAGQ
jgi:hypothetical protein